MPEGTHGTHGKERSWRFVSSEIRAAAYGTLLHRQKVEIHELCAKDCSRDGQLARDIRGELRQSSVGGKKLFNDREMAHNTANHYQYAEKHMQAAQYKILAGQLCMKDSLRGQALASFKEAEELQHYFKPDPTSWDATQAADEQFAMSKAWNGSDTKKALQHLVKALYLLWKLYTKKTTDTKQELDYNSMNAEMEDLLTMVDLMANRLASSTTRRSASHSLGDRSNAAKDLILAELMLFDLCVNRQETSVGATVMNGTKAMARAVTVLENTPHLESENVWLRSNVTACQCIALVILDAEGRRDEATDYAQRTATFLASHTAPADRQLATTLVHLSRYHAAMDDPNSCCFRLGELYATAETLAETFFREVFLLELASLAQAEMDDKTALKIFRNLSTSQHNAHRTESRVGIIRCLWRMVRGLGRNKDGAMKPPEDLQRETMLLDEELRKIRPQVQDEHGTIRRSYPLVYAEMHAIMGSRFLVQKEHSSAVAYVEKAAKIFDMACEPTIYSAYFALESVVDAVLEVSAASAAVELASGRARSMSSSGSDGSSSRASGRKKRSSSARYGRGAASAFGGAVENERMLDKLALHVQCYMILGARVVDIYRRLGHEGRLPEWMLDQDLDMSMSADGRRHANTMLTRYAMLGDF